MEHQDNTTDNRSFEVNSLVSFDTLFWDRDYMRDFSPENIDAWINDPMTYNRQLRELSRVLYGSSGFYGNVVDYMVSLPTLDSVVYGSNKTHSRYMKNKNVFVSALEKIKHKILTRDILLKAAIDGVYFGYFNSQIIEENLPDTLSDTDVANIKEINESKFNCAVTQLPTDYCKIRRMVNGSYQIMFNVKYFDQFRPMGTREKLLTYPKEIRDAYKNYRNSKSQNWITLDVNKTIAIKIRANSSEPWGRPLGLPAFSNISYDKLLVKTKRNVLSDLNSTIIYQTFPEGEKKGTSSLNQKQQEKQHENVKAALFGRRNKNGANLISLSAGTKMEKLKVDTDVLNVKSEDELIKRISTDLGFAGSALNGQDGNFSSQQTNIQMVTSQILSWMEQIVSEYIKVINANIVRDLSVPVKMYYLPTTFVNRKETVTYLKDLYTQGKGSLQAWIAATGFDTEAYLALMDEEIEENFDEKYKPHMTSFTMSGNDSTAGRPESDNPTNENTLKTKTNNGNANPRAN